MIPISGRAVKTMQQFAGANGAVGSQNLRMEETPQPMEKHRFLNNPLPCSTCEAGPSARRRLNTSQFFFK